ncbi:MAG: LacI family DNA-binding transcriptional regulator [Acidimicrobiales bacterium]
MEADDRGGAAVNAPERSPRRSHRVTSHDVAAEAGVSQATVARAYSSPNLVAAETRARVEEAASRLGYVPNAIARSLKSQRTHMIGAVVPARGEYWQGVLTAFSRQLAGSGRQLLLFSFEDADDVDQALAAVDQYRLDGLILASATISEERLARMRRPGTPVVVFNQPAAKGVLPLVTVDNEAGTNGLAAHLVELGVETVLYIGGVAAASTDEIRYRGAAKALGSSGIACPYLEAGQFTYEAGYEVVARLVADGPLPDALMVGSDEVAFGVIDRLRTEGFDVPGDILVTGFDGLPQARWAGYDLTTLVQPIDVLVAEAIAILLRGDGVDDPVAVVAPGTIRTGKTTGVNHE